MVVGLNPEAINGRELSTFEYSGAGIVSGNYFHVSFLPRLLSHILNLISSVFLRYNDESHHPAVGRFEDQISGRLHT